MGLILSLLMFCTSALFTPGPNNIMIMASGLNYGIRKSIPHYLGICLGFPLMLAFIGLGLSSLFTNFPVLQTVIKTLGIAYILYLAWKIATSKPELNDSQNTRETKPLSFINATLFQWANPKAWVISISAFSAFSSLSSNVTLRTLIITTSFLFVGFLSAGLWMFFGVRLKKYLNNPQAMRAFNYTMGCLLAASAVLILLENAHHK